MIRVIIILQLCWESVSVNYAAWSYTRRKARSVLAAFRTSFNARMRGFRVQVGGFVAALCVSEGFERACSSWSELVPRSSSVCFLACESHANFCRQDVSSAFFVLPSTAFGRTSKNIYTNSTRNTILILVTCSVCCIRPSSRHRPVRTSCWWINCTPGMSPSVLMDRFRAFECTLLLPVLCTLARHGDTTFLRIFQEPHERDALSQFTTR